MPMYDFRCTKCEHVFEEVTKSDAPPPACPQCGEPSERQLGAVNYAPKRMSAKGQKYAALHKKRGTKPYSG
jgi:putative FmdB family regulatory protein